MLPAEEQNGRGCGWSVDFGPDHCKRATPAVLRCRAASGVTARNPLAGRPSSGGLHRSLFPDRYRADGDVEILRIGASPSWLELGSDLSLSGIGVGCVVSARIRLTLNPAGLRPDAHCHSETGHPQYGPVESSARLPSAASERESACRVQVRQAKERPRTRTPSGVRRAATVATAALAGVTCVVEPTADRAPPGVRRTGGWLQSAAPGRRSYHQVADPGTGPDQQPAGREPGHLRESRRSNGWEGGSSQPEASDRLTFVWPIR